MPSTQLSTKPLATDDELIATLAAIPGRFGIERAFPAPVLAEAENAARTVELPELDRTDVPFVTIDPAGSTDLDQAMFLEKLPTGYRVLYAIADVPAFVRPGGAIDGEARHRGQTVYAPDGRIPLHPVNLSEGAASLLPYAVRGAFLWDLRLDESAAVTKATVRRARVRSVSKLDYAGVQASIDAGSARPMLMLLREIGTKRIALEQARGGASLGTQETEVELRDGEYVIERRMPFAVENWNAQISLMTGMAAADIMLGAKVGLLRTMPPAAADAVAKFRAQAAALGSPWPTAVPYGEYLRSLDVTRPKNLAIMHAAASLFRGAGYTAFDGSVPATTEQAAVGAAYAHVTAPLRRLVDRFTLVACEAICAGEPVPQWVRDALPELAHIMSSTSAAAGQVNAAAIDTVEAAVLRHRIGDVFSATVLSSSSASASSASASSSSPAAGYGTIQLDDPAITARCDGAMIAGAVISARLVTADIATGSVRFTVA